MVASCEARDGSTEARARRVDALATRTVLFAWTDAVSAASTMLSNTPATADPRTYETSAVNKARVIIAY